MSSHHISASYLGDYHIFHPTGGVLKPDLLRCPALALATSDSFQILETSGVGGGEGPLSASFIMHLAFF